MTLVALKGHRLLIGCPYRVFCRRWKWALIGGRWHGFWFRFHLRIGVQIRCRVRLLPVICIDTLDPDRGVRKLWLNPRQIVYAAEASA